MANTFEIFLRTYGAEAAAQAAGRVQSAYAGVTAALASVGGAISAVAVITVAIRSIKSMLDAAEESRVALSRLQTALEASGQAGRGFAESLAAQAERLESLTGVSDETTLGVQSMLLSMGATAEQVQALSPLVLDLAAAMGTDATTAARQLGQALEGQEVQLGRLNIKVKSFDELLEVLNQRVRGQASALMEARGPLAAIGVEFGIMAENIGEAIAQWSSPAFQALADVLKTARQDFTGIGNPSQFGPLRSGLFPLNAPSAQSAASGPDEESSAIEAERARQITAARQLMQVEADLNNQYAFRRALIAQDPNLSETERKEGLLGVLREEVSVQQQLEELKRADYERALTVDPERNLETTIEAETALGDAQLRRLQIQQQIKSIEESGTFGGRLRQQVRGLADEYGNLAVSMANVTFNTVTQGVQGLAGALTAVITGAQSAGQAFAQFGMSLLTNFIQMVLTAVLYAKVAIPILTALGVVSGGVTAATGAGVTTAAIATTLGTVMGMVGRKEGGYTGDGSVDQIAGWHHRGEFIVPAWRTAQIGVPALEQMTFGGGDAPRGETPIQVVILDDRSTVDELRRNPRFRTLVVDLAQGA